MTGSNWLQEAQIQAITSMNLAADYLAKNLDQLTDPFDVCTVTYALHLAHHSVKDEAFRKMMKLKRVGEDMVQFLQ